MSIFGSDDKAIQVIAELKAKSGKEDEVRRMFTALVAPSQKEHGCKKYHCTRTRRTPGISSRMKSGRVKMPWTRISMVPGRSWMRRSLCWTGS